MAHKTAQAFRSWQLRMGFTQVESARRLDMCVASLRNYSNGKRRDKKGEPSRKAEIPQVVLLACAAIEAGLSPIR